MPFGGFQYIRKRAEPVEKLSGPAALRLLTDAALRAEGRISRSFLQDLENMRGRISANELRDLIRRGDSPEIIRRLVADDLEGYPELRRAITEAVQEGARMAAEGQGTYEHVNGQVYEMQFDATNPEVYDYARQIGSTRIREISLEQREAIRQTLSSAVQRGQNPWATARELKDQIGLTTRQRLAVLNYREALEQMDRSALERELRDRRFDPTVRAALASGKPLSTAQVRRLVARYEERYRAYIRQGRVDRERVRRYWFASPDDRTRLAHATIPGMNENGVGAEEPFKSILGPIMFPGDPEAVAANVINCRCTTGRASSARPDWRPSAAVEGRLSRLQATSQRSIRGAPVPSSARRGLRAAQRLFRASSLPGPR